MVDLKRDKGMFQVHPESEPIYAGTPGKHSQEFLVKIEKDWYKNFDLVKDIKIEDDEVVDTQFYGDIMDDINIKEQEQYVQLMNTFLNRADKRKLKRYKGFKSFTDRIYGR